MSPTHFAAKKKMQAPENHPTDPMDAGSVYHGQYDDVYPLQHKYHGPQATTGLEPPPLCSRHGRITIMIRRGPLKNGSSKKRGTPPHRWCLLNGNQTHVSNIPARWSMCYAMMAGDIVTSLGEPSELS